ncbi:MAG: TonB-dependent receptor [Desulfobulbus sp.]|jgi:iron complex outermembrane receptor protein|uniref:TonB-dependent receptor n=1 Tax=Desulfobulbus sp. TaxID=895 RepID=UPI00283C36FD|nr:TonB-dependent receptor [Desulfobulbus sp.]MDR2549240.1 TonB-dependent receptor [Desulfobulbus sp.]
MTAVFVPQLLAVGYGAEEEKKNDLYYLEPIVVTAEKTAQDVQRIPGSVSAYTKSAIEERHVEKLYDLTDYVPNVFVKKNSTENIISIRGISPQQGSLFSATGLYVDGVNYPIHQMQNLDFLDIERVEVLKGPQGTLYGRNSEAGVINVITSQPTDEFGGKVFGEIGMWDARGGVPIYREGATVNVPLVQDTLAMKVALQNYTTDGWMENTAPGSLEDATRAQHFNGRVTTRWTPTAAWDVSLILQGQHEADGIGVYRFSDGPFATDRNEIAWNGPNKNSVDANAQILKAEYHGAEVDITSVTGRHSYSQDYMYDMDMTPVDLYPQYPVFNADYDVDIWSEELRIASKPGQGRRFDWLAGIYVYSEDIQTGNYSITDHVTDQDDLGGALFAQGTLHMWEKWHFNLGSRIEYARLEGKKDVNSGMMGMGTMHLEDTVEDTVFLPSASISYDLAPQVMTYGKVSRGYLSGGFDNYFAMSQDLFSYEPEYSWNYEVGIKSKMLDNRLMMNLAAFYIDVDDKQVVEYVSPFERYVVNAAKVESYGVELDVQYKPMPGLTLTGSLGYLESEIKDWATEGYNARDYSGNKTPGAPEFSYAAGIVYRWESGWYIGADVVGVSSNYSSAENDLKVDGRTLVNARMGYEGEKFDIMLWGRNIFNEEYEERSMKWLGGTLIQEGEPGSFGLLVAYKF